MISESKFCKGCGQKVNTNVFLNLASKTFVEIDGEYYCMTCGREVVKKRRERLK
jgi:hypothetical protein